MANAFGIITALVLAAAAFFGLKNKAALANQRDLLVEEDRNLKLNTDTFEKRKVELSELEEERVSANEESAALSEKLEAQLAKNKALLSDIDDKKGSVDSKKTQVEEGEEKLANFGNLDDLKRNLEQLSTDLATLNGELLLRNTEIKTRKDVNVSFKIENSAMDDVLSRYTRKESLPGLNSSVSRVVSDLGFVILTGGDNAGIIRDSVLDVQRGGTTIGKVKVTGTEPSTAAASIIPDSFKDGMRIRVGDKVVASSK